MTILATNLGYPRIGAKRELKRALESFWAGRLDESDLNAQSRNLRQSHWQIQQAAGLAHVPSNDFSLYDHVLDTVALTGAVPDRYNWSAPTVDLATYFAMARGTKSGKDAQPVPAMEMTKWFDTNYHYIVPEFKAGQTFRLASSKPVDHFLEAKNLGIHTRPVLLGPVSFLLLGKTVGESPVEPLSLLENLLPVYEEVLAKLAAAGADWVQIDEPCLVLDLDNQSQLAYGQAYRRLSAVSPQLRLLVATYFGDLGANLQTAAGLPVAALHLDLVRAPQQLEKVLEVLPEHLSLSLGLVDGRNIWRTDLAKARALLELAVAKLGEARVLVGPSCSLLHSPVDLDLETRLDPEFRSWLAFARQKLAEIDLLSRSFDSDNSAIAGALEANRLALESRRTSTRIHQSAVQARLASLTLSMFERKSPFEQRKTLQQARLNLPLLPTTTIGSFPQTQEIRTRRAAFSAGSISKEEYEGFLKKEIEQAIRFQEEIGLDVLVHGEAERTDMVEYFGEQLEGVAFTGHGWVQSYGSRCVRPPVIYGDVVRSGPMTVKWAEFAQSLTSKPVKGMLTGPVTILQWSFVRDDQPRSTTCRQIGLAIRDEVQDLEAAGIRIIQIDEPALREGLPLRKADWAEYLGWSVDCFRLAAAGVADETQIHTHMCYAEFNDILEAITRMDADVISIEASRSRLELLSAFANYHYPNDVGPGVYDIHSPNIPAQASIETLLRLATEVLSTSQLWVNPDCGLKTRRWEEVRPALVSMVEAARNVRETFSHRLQLT
jgi:5-methyltetrahydropteroyltriglutamate--homocysteine methyltransferase